MSTRTRIEVRRGADGRVTTRLRGAHLAPRRLPDVDGTVRVALVATQALLLAGDEVGVDVEVGDGIRLEVVETSGTVAYDMRGGRAGWHVDVGVASGASLVWSGLPFVVADGADVERHTRVALEPGAQALLRETLVLGRTGEAGGRLLSTLTARLGGRVLLTEETALDPVSRRDPALLGGARVLDVLTALGHRLTDPAALQLEGEGSVLRWLGAATHASTHRAVTSSALPARTEPAEHEVLVALT
ncbi:MAG: Urease accessory protein UreH-like protein [Humibacillus sp.]|nr:Urease accessory protein UreH-like protein [Humibacillus sp.]